MENPPGADPLRSDDGESALAGVERSLSHLTRISRPSRIFGVVLDAEGGVLDRAAYSVLLRMEEFGTIRLTDLANVMEIDISTASRHVHSLDRRGLIDRAEDPEDQRTTLLRLNPAGADVLARSRALRVAGIRHRLRDWSDRDVTSLARLLARLAESLSGPAEVTDAPDAAAKPHKTKTSGRS